MMTFSWISTRTRAVSYVVIAISAFGYCDHVFAKTVPLACVNRSSGFRWNAVVDYDHARVDTNPATITATSINWYDPADGGFYDFDRISGDLTVRHASSVGGYFLYHTCHLG